MNINHRYTLGMIGLGHVYEAQAEALKHVPSLSIVALCDEDVSKRPHGHSLYFYSRPEEVLGDEGVDAVVVSVSNARHFAVARMCILARKHVLLEKPATETLAELIALYELADKCGVRLVVAFHASFALELKWYLESYSPNMDGTFGPLTAFKCGFYDPLISWAGESPHAAAIGGSWTNNGINALSVIDRIVSDLRIVDSRFTCPPGFTSSEIQATVDFRFPLQRVKGSGFGSIDTNWAIGRPDKHTTLFFMLSGNVITVNHSRQVLFHEAPDGTVKEVASFAGTLPRLVSDYIGVFTDFVSHLDRGTDNREIALRVHRYLYEARTKYNSIPHSPRLD